MPERPITKADQANAARLALTKAMAKMRITPGQRRAIVNNVTITTPPGVTPEDIAGSVQEMLDPYKAKPKPVKPDPVVAPHARRNPFRRRVVRVIIEAGDQLPRGRVIHVRSAGGIELLLVRRG